MIRIRDNVHRAMQADGYSVVKVAVHGKGLGVLGQNETMDHVLYVSGTSYEMGFLTGRLMHERVEETCTTYLRHMIPQFIAEDFDIVMQNAPLLIGTVYDSLLEWLTNILVKDSAQAFQKAVHNGDIPMYILEELDGMVKGVSSMRAISVVTRNELIAANFGMDYLFNQILSGHIFKRLKKFLSQFAFEMPVDLKKMLTIPEMCNAAIIGHSATESGRDAYLLRDFQFFNGRVYDRNCMFIIRDGRPDYLLTCSVAIPGLLGAITCVNQASLACGMNVVRSEAVDTARLGCGMMFLNRQVMDSATTVDEMEVIVRRAHLGTPWLFYGLDHTGEGRVFELVGRNHDLKRQEEWKPKYQNSNEYLANMNLHRWQQEEKDGVWTRTGFHHEGGEDELREFNEQLGAPITFATLREELESKNGHCYFPLWRPQPDVIVVTNMFMNPIVRRTEMTHRMRTLNLNLSTGWRYETLSKMIAKYHGTINVDRCKMIISFLNPTDQPTYIGNMREFERYSKILGVSFQSFEKDSISGSLSVVDINNCVIYNKFGNWRRQFASVSLKLYL